jgi:hypothetical protein
MNTLRFKCSTHEAETRNASIFTVEEQQKQLAETTETQI